MRGGQERDAGKAAAEMARGAGGEGAERRAEGAASWQTGIITSFLEVEPTSHS